MLSTFMFVVGKLIFFYGFIHSNVNSFFPLIHILVFIIESEWESKKNPDDDVVKCWVHSTSLLGSRWIEYYRRIIKEYIWSVFSFHECVPRIRIEYEWSKDCVWSRLNSILHIIIRQRWFFTGEWWFMSFLKMAVGRSLECRRTVA